MGRLERKVELEGREGCAQKGRENVAHGKAREGRETACCGMFVRGKWWW